MNGPDTGMSSPRRGLLGLKLAQRSLSDEMLVPQSGILGPSDEQAADTVISSSRPV